MKRLLTVVSLVVVMFGVVGPMVQIVQAQDVTIVVTSLVRPPTQGCSGVQMSMDPIEPYAVGTVVIIQVHGNCPTVKISILNLDTGQSWDGAEETDGNTTINWDTQLWGSGHFRVCGLSRGDGGWENAAIDCRDVYVEGGQAPPPGSTHEENNYCGINTFVVTPSSGPIGTTFSFVVQGQCDGNARASRFLIDGNPWGENGSYQARADWNSSNASIGNHEICGEVTSGEWYQAARSCVTITVTSAGTEPANSTVQGPQTTNGQPGQTPDSIPSMVDHPGGDPPANDSNSSNGSSNAGTCRSYSGDITNAQQLVVDVEYDAYLNVRTNSETGSQILDQLHRGDVVTAIGNPVCSGGLYWIEIGYNGRSGWVAIAGRDGQYLIVNGQPLTSDSSNQNSSSNDTDQDLSGWEGMNTSTNEQPDLSAWEGMNTSTNEQPDLNAWEGMDTPVSEEPVYLEPQSASTYVPSSDPGYDLDPAPNAGSSAEINYQVIDNRRRAYEIGMTNLQQAGIAIAELGDNTAFWIEVAHGSANAGDWVCFIGGQTSTRVDIVCTLVGFLPGPGSPTFWFSAAKGTALLNVYVDSWLEEYIYNSNIKPSCIYGHLTNNQELLQYCNN